MAPILASPSSDPNVLGVAIPAAAGGIVLLVLLVMMIRKYRDGEKSGTAGIEDYLRRHGMEDIYSKYYAKVGAMPSDENPKIYGSGNILDTIRGGPENPKIYGSGNIMDTMRGGPIYGTADKAGTIAGTIAGFNSNYNLGTSTNLGWPQTEYYIPAEMGEMAPGYGVVSETSDWNNIMTKSNQTATLQREAKAETLQNKRDSKKSNSKRSSGNSIADVISASGWPQEDGTIPMMHNPLRGPMSSQSSANRDLFGDDEMFGNKEFDTIAESSMNMF